MKKNMLMLAALLCCLMTLTACGDDKDDPNVIATGTYTVTFSPDILDVASVIIYYKGNNNVNRFEAITPDMLRNNTWTKTVTSNKFPAEMGVQFVISLKEESELTREKYNLVINSTFNGSVSGEGSHSDPEVICNYPEIEKKDVIKRMQGINRKSHGFRIHKDGRFDHADLNYDI